MTHVHKTFPHVGHFEKNDMHWRPQVGTKGAPDTLYDSMTLCFVIVVIVVIVVILRHLYFSDLSDLSDLSVMALSWGLRTFALSDREWWKASTLPSTARSRTGSTGCRWRGGDWLKGLVAWCFPIPGIPHRYNSLQEQNMTQTKTQWSGPGLLSIPAVHADTAQGYIHCQAFG